MMRPMVFLVPIVLALAGCTDGGDSDDFSLEDGDGGGELFVEVFDDAPRMVDIGVAGAWVQRPQNGSWVPFVTEPGVWSFDGSGDTVVSGSALPAGAYERLRVVFSSVQVDGVDAVMAQSGLDLPLVVPVPVGGTSTLQVAFAWEEALIETGQGLAFVPVLASLSLLVDGDEVATLSSEELAGAGKPPVARMRVFDDAGLQVYQSDFVAEGPDTRVIATAGNVTFTASPSETLDEAAEIVTYAWDFGDGTTGEGVTVTHAYPLSGGNVTVTLTVTDSNGVNDDLLLDIALVPPKVSHTFTFTGTAGGAISQGMVKTHTFDVDGLVGPDGGTALGILTVRGQLRPVGAPLPGNDLDMDVKDGGGRLVGQGTSDGSQEDFTKEYDLFGSQPNAGSWTATVKPFVAGPTDYEVKVTITWQMGDDPQYLAWALGHDDGHTHQH